MGKEVQKQRNELEERLLAIDDAYQEETRYFLDYCADRGFDIVQGIFPYIDSLNDGFIDQAGKKHFYSAQAYNKRVFAVKNRIRYALKHSDQYHENLKLRYQVEELLDQIKPKKINGQGVDESKLLTWAEVLELVEKCRNPKICLLIQFLAEVGSRISETLEILESDIKVLNGICQIKLRGKGNKERVVYARTDLVAAIRAEFGGKDYLFEHGGKTYNRQSITRRISLEALNSIGRGVSAHMLRHAWASEQVRLGRPIDQVSRWLGHSKVSTTVDIYLHGTLKPEEGILPTTTAAPEPEVFPAPDAIEKALKDALNPDRLIKELKKNRSKK